MHFVAVAVVFDLVVPLKYFGLGFAPRAADQVTPEASTQLLFIFLPSGPFSSSCGKSSDHMTIRYLSLSLKMNFVGVVSGGAGGGGHC